VDVRDCFEVASIVRLKYLCSCRIDCSFVLAESEIGIVLEAWAVCLGLCSNIGLSPGNGWYLWLK
jgi:hypothetical protein